ncbi:hypothetical protein, partial [Microbacterium sp. CPCC 204701]|uniref:hypothetical protein n=1 Tax=Microbacterium sp. CPCC 204701 TaxID=2493084 RepID=UPI00197C4586
VTLVRRARGRSAASVEVKTTDAAAPPLPADSTTTSGGGGGRRVDGARPHEGRRDGGPFA